MCLGQSVSMTASGAVSYAWSPGASLNNSTTANVVATPTITTQYTVTGSDANACVGSVQYTVTVQNCTGLEEESTATFDLYPNPASQVVTIASINETTIQHIAITDLSGRVLKVIPVQESTVNVEDLSVGKYFFVIQHEGGTAVKSFVKN
jgi:hypothetical protein